MQVLNQGDMLGRSIDKNTPLFASLAGAREALKRFLSLRDLPIIQSNDVKAFLRQQQKPEYPYSYMSFTDIAIQKDGQAVKNLRRVSQGSSVHHATNSTVSKFYGFPAIISMELHFVTNDILAAVNFTTRSLITMHTEALNFDLECEAFSWKVQITTDSESISFPRSDKDNEADPESFDMVLPLKIRTYIGVVKDVAKINNDGKVTTGIGIKERDGSFNMDT